MERVFLEWVAVAVGARDRTGKKVQSARIGGREFFTDGPLHSGCRIHLHRREERASLFDEETPRTPQLSKKPPLYSSSATTLRGCATRTLREACLAAAPERAAARLELAARGHAQSDAHAVGRMAGTYGAAAM